MEDRMKAYGCVCLVLLLSSCATSRKISQLPLRDLASVQVFPESDNARQNFQTVVFPSSCPKPIQDILRRIASEEMEVVSCPSELSLGLDRGYRFIRIEERSLLEEVLSSDCHSFGVDRPEEVLSAIMQRSSPDSSISVEAIAQLKESIETILKVHLPLSKWKESNGSFVLPEEELRFLQHFSLKEGCKVQVENLESAYKTVRILEEAKRNIRREETRELIENFLSIFQSTLDKHLIEYFYP